MKSNPQTLKKIALFLGMLFGTALTGAVAGGIFALIGMLIMKDRLFGLGGIVGSFGGVVIGYPIGVIAGVVLFRKWLKYKGSIPFGVIGCLLGAVIIMVLAVPLRVDIPVAWTLTLYFIAAPLLGAVGFYLGRKTAKKQKRRRRKKS